MKKLAQAVVIAAAFGCWTALQIAHEYVASVALALWTIAALFFL